MIPTDRSNWVHLPGPAAGFHNQLHHLSLYFHYFLMIFYFTSFSSLIYYCFTLIFFSFNLHLLGTVFCSRIQYTSQQSRPV